MREVLQLAFVFLPDRLFPVHGRPALPKGARAAERPDAGVGMRHGASLAAVS